MAELAESHWQPQPPLLPHWQTSQTATIPTMTLERSASWKYPPLPASRWLLFVPARATAGRRHGPSLPSGHARLPPSKAVSLVEAVVLVTWRGSMEPAAADFMQEARLRSTPLEATTQTTSSRSSTSCPSTTSCCARPAGRRRCRSTTLCGPQLFPALLQTRPFIFVACLHSAYMLLHATLMAAVQGFPA